jgi:hypothetical protein
MDITQYQRVEDQPHGSLASPDSSFRLKKANMAYVALFVIVGCLCFVLYNTGDSWLGGIIKTNYSRDTNKSELLISLVARTSAASAVFYLIHSLCMICNPNLIDSCQFILHVSWPPLHYLIFLGFYAVFLFAVPDPFFDGYIQFAYGASAVYLVIQVFFLIAWFYDLNEKFTNTENFCALTTITVVLGLLALAGYGVGFWQFHDDQTALIVLSVNLAVSVLLFGAAAFIESASIFTASLICAYTSFLTFTGCRCLEPLGKTDIVIAVVFSLITLIWVGYSAFSTTTDFRKECSCSDNEGEEAQFSLSFFHGLFALASVYLTMLATNWVRKDANEWSLGKGKVAMWVNWSTSWATELLYVWTLIAPFILKGRDFG